MWLLIANFFLKENILDGISKLDAKEIEIFFDVIQNFLECKFSKNDLECTFEKNYFDAI